MPKGITTNFQSSGHYLETQTLSWKKCNGFKNYNKKEHMIPKISGHIIVKAEKMKR